LFYIPKESRAFFLGVLSGLNSTYHKQLQGIVAVAESPTTDGGSSCGKLLVPLVLSLGAGIGDSPNLLQTNTSLVTAH